MVGLEPTSAKPLIYSQFPETNSDTSKGTAGLEPTNASTKN